MKSFTYPIVFILNRETGQYNGFIPDLAIAAEGATLEEVIKHAQELLAKFFELATKYDTDVPPPSTLESTYAKWKGYKIMYVTAMIK
jgi:predicted RNase H-like HicB family nuclease